MRKNLQNGKQSQIKHLCVTLGIVAMLASLVPSVAGQINSAAEDINGYHIYVDVQGAVISGKVYGFSWDSQANCTGGSNPNCPTSAGTALAIFAIWNYNANGATVCVQSCNGFVSAVSGSWAPFSITANGPSGVAASWVMNQGSSGYVTATSYVQKTNLNDAGLPFF